jgi:hypothetical protein
VTAWSYDPAYDPRDYASFIYRVTLPDGRYYVGKKALWVHKCGKLDRESDWQGYWGSSKDLKLAIKSVGREYCTREIIAFCVTRGEASWREAEVLIKGDCLLDPFCMNGNVLERFNGKVVRGYANDERRQRYMRDHAAARDALA